MSRIFFFLLSEPSDISQKNRQDFRESKLFLKFIKRNFEVKTFLSFLLF